MLQREQQILQNQQQNLFSGPQQAQALYEQQLRAQLREVSAGPVPPRLSLLSGRIMLKPNKRANLKWKLCSMNTPLIHWTYDGIDYLYVVTELGGIDRKLLEVYYSELLL